ncbi:MAG: M20/M25/M40 family metallo-hydrolase [Parvularculaceae bacterium]|nr:M20/M25/M40 family metallo-hydrolase [Parvularculaceae bacterium]
MRLVLIAALLSTSALAETNLTPDEHDARALEILRASVNYRSVQGDSASADHARYLAKMLVAGGFATADVEVDLNGAAPTLIATYQGTTDAPPLLLSGHMDVVEADPADWSRDPFTAVVENGYVYGRGAVDNKFDNSMIVATLLRLKGEGFKPMRDVILVLSGDEETEMVTTESLAARFKGAHLVLNGDGGGGTLREDGTPLAYNLQTAEKTYADYEIAFTNPGGHSSRPSKENAIYRLARAIERIGAYDFPAAASDTTRAFFRETGAMTSGPLGDAMQRYAENPKDKKAIKALRADPEYVGQLGTTCVATMLDGGHALNALPQRATVSVNCRIFPGVDPKQVEQTLLEVAGDDTATIRRLENTIAGPASPMREDVTAAVRKSIERRYPGLPVIPQMSAGATDSLHFRAQGVDSYGVSGLFMKPSDDFSHGLNERAPIASIDGALDHWHVLITALSQ